MKQFALSNPVERELGPLTKALRGRKLADVALIRDGMIIRTTDGVLVFVQWGSQGAELAGLRIIDATRDYGPPQLEPRFQYTLGREVDCVRSEEGIMGIVLKDGHILRCDWRARQPKPAAVDVRLELRLPEMRGLVGPGLH